MAKTDALSVACKMLGMGSDISKVSKCEKYLLIENDSIYNLINGVYGSEFNTNSYIANFILLQKRNDLNVYFVNRYNMGLWILKLFYYHYYEIIKGVGQVG